VPSDFEIDRNISDSDNIKAFLEYLKAHDPELTSILARHISRLIPLPPLNQPQRARVRAEFNSAISTELDSLPSPE